MRNYLLLILLVVFTPLQALTNDLDQSSLVERGEYLVYGPAACVRCHGSIEQMEAFENHGEKIPLGGGRTWHMYLGTFVAPNITSDRTQGIGGWSTKQLEETLRNDLGNDGKALIPMMEYHQMNDADLAAIIAWLKTSQPVTREINRSHWSWIGKIAQWFLTRSASTDIAQIPPIEPAPTAEYGRYLAEDVAQCGNCHTRRSQTTGRFEGARYAGGSHLQTTINPSLYVVPPNITPKGVHSVIRDWTLADFLQRFSEGLKLQGSHMPWGAFQHMNKRDVTAIWKYLQTVPSSDYNPGPPLQTQSD
ncbi:Gluconate 2-dehydrogenase cytochrome c subunit [BD1-7 clade bacterium]|uniref:Gluconate 2-dehydrogenase cytochrome c subunit n=1 Tax=BD1-7 clade bacterium TaxID=2029982 RepID=A0A5S9PTB8_9GAMM|nr:Gluconate 2-dehydrogenase cytochrome c subunit [BD1-7 clade bacterium]